MVTRLCRRQGASTGLQTSSIFTRSDDDHSDLVMISDDNVDDVTLSKQLMMVLPKVKCMCL